MVNGSIHGPTDRPERSGLLQAYLACTIAKQSKTAGEEEDPRRSLANKSKRRAKTWQRHNGQRKHPRADRQAGAKRSAAGLSGLHDCEAIEDRAAKGSTASLASQTKSTPNQDVTAPQWSTEAHTGRPTGRSEAVCCRPIWPARLQSNRRPRSEGERRA